jgi:hypothetical protein
MEPALVRLLRAFAGRIATGEGFFRVRRAVVARQQVSLRAGAWVVADST